MQCKGTDNKVINCRNGKKSLKILPTETDPTLFTSLLGGFLQIASGTFDDVGERSQFESPVLDALSTEGCVQFQYNIDGTDNDWLNVYVEDY